MRRDLEYSQSDPLHPILGEPFFTPIVKVRCSRAFVRRQFLGVLEVTFFDGKPAIFCAVIRKIDKTEYEAR
jgi:hypothetical protein